MRPIVCKMVDLSEPEGLALFRMPPEEREPGVVFYAPWYLREEYRGQLSDYYTINNFNRPPICVVVPTGHIFCPDGKCSVGPGKMAGGWVVKGEPPKVTVEGTITLVGMWTGCLKDGVLTD